MEVSLHRGSRLAITLGICMAASMLFGQTGSNRATAPAPQTAAPMPVFTGRAAPLQRELNDTHRIRPGDKVTFRVDEDGEEAKVLTVTDSGEIELPYNFGRVIAADKTCKALAQELKVALEKEYYNRATVHIGLDSANKERGKAYVSGQVSKPGPVTIPTDAPLKLSQAILLAGPPTQWAKLSAVKVVRQVGGKAETKTIDVNAILSQGRLENDMALEPDDLVIVPERGVVF